MKNTKTYIYCLSHKDFTPPQDKIYLPLSVFEKNGDNIAEKNCYYSELTGCYWVWKNSDADIVGICHYRRYLLNENGSLLNESQIHKALKEYDLITTRVLTLNFPYEYGFSKNHKPYYLEQLEILLKEEYPEVYPVYKELVGGVNTLFGNMLICRKGLYDEYSKWLFDILFNLESRIVIQEEDSYHRRIFGFISEFLLYVFIRLRKLRVKHVMVGMLGEKTEVRTIKEKLSKILLSGDIQGAKEYFLREHEKRPDILMEASDIGFELHLLMEAISISEFEKDAGRKPFVLEMENAGTLYAFLRRLNDYVNKKESGDPPDKRISPQALYVAKKMFENI